MCTFVNILSDFIPDASIFQERQQYSLTVLYLCALSLSFSRLNVREMGAHGRVVLCLETQCPESKSNLRERQTEREFSTLEAFCLLICGVLTR